MLRLTCKTQIQGKQTWELHQISECEITRDTATLTDTCKLTIPQNIKWRSNSALEGHPINRGDKVRVWLGYNDRLELAFQGYVRSVGQKAPIVIECEDEMFKLKSQPAKPLAYKKVNLDTLLRDQGISYQTKILGEQELGQYRVKADTIASLLGELKGQGIRSFFRLEGGEPVLYAGVIFSPKEVENKGHMQVFSNKLNIISNTNLKQVKADTMRLKVKAISIMPDNKRIKVEVGDKDGELIKLHTYNKEEGELRKWAEQEVKRRKRDGLTGDFETFGDHLVDKLEVIGIKLNGIKQGKYQVKKNIIKFGASGYRQNITLGFRVE